MKAVIQRTGKTSLSVDGKLISEIPFGLTVYFGVEVGDTEKQAEAFAKKIVRLRIFEDENGKMNKSVLDVKGEILFVSQFTLLADCTGTVLILLPRSGPKRLNCFMNGLPN